MTRHSLARITLVGAFASLAGTAHAYPLNPWGVGTPQGTLVLNPFLYAYPAPISKVPPPR